MEEVEAELQDRPEASKMCETGRAVEDRNKGAVSDETTREKPPPTRVGGGRYPVSRRFISPPCGQDGPTLASWDQPFGRIVG